MKRHFGIWSITCMLLMAAGLLGGYRLQVSQARKDAALLQAVQNGDTAYAIGLLDDGADADAKLSRDEPKSFAEYLRQVVHRIRNASSPANSPTSLLLSLEPKPLSPGSSVLVVPHENPKLIRALLDHGADPNAIDVNRSTALVEACSHHFHETAKLLIAAGADVNHVSEGSPGTALGFAALHGNGEITELLLSNGADPRLADRSETTPLELAVGYGYTRIAKRLLDSGAAANFRGGHGFTPLIRAAEAGSLDCVKLLLSRGADPNLKSDGGYTASSRAREEGHMKVVNLLRQHGAYR